MLSIGLIKKKITRVIQYLRTDPIFVLLYFFRYFDSGYKVDAHFMSDKEVAEAMRSGLSFIRYGDGEVALMKGTSIEYQKADRLLAKRLKEPIQAYTKNSPYILAIPKRYINKTNKELRKIKLFRCWLPFKIAFEEYFSSDFSYADAHAFYVKGFFETNLSAYLSQKKIIIVTTAANIKKQKEIMESHFKNVYWLEARSPDPFDWFDKNMNDIKAIVGDEKSDFVALLGAGPSSKVLAFDLAQQGVQCLDIGHGFEFFYREKSLDHVLI